MGRAESPTTGAKGQLALPKGWPRRPAVRGMKAIRRLLRPRASLLLGISVGLLAIAACGTSLEPAPDFQFSLYQGEDLLGEGDLSLSNLQGRPVVLNFWAGLCPPCRAEMPELQEFYEEYGDRVTLFGLDVGPFWVGLGNNQDARDLINWLGISYPAGPTSDETVVREYEILGMPSTVFITSDGKIFRKWTGILNRDKLVEITEQMLGHSGPNRG